MNINDTDRTIMALRAELDRARLCTNPRGAFAGARA